jgi:hypothetical protein
MLFFARYVIAIAFGGVPIGVPRPPRLHANGMESAIAMENPEPFGIWRMIGKITANIIAAVAVLLIHMEKKAEISITNSNKRDAFPRDLPRIHFAILWSRLYL